MNAQLGFVSLRPHGARLIVELTGERAAVAYRAALLFAAEACASGILPSVDRNARAENGARVVFESDRKISVRQLHAVADALNASGIDTSLFFEAIREP